MEEWRKKEDVRFVKNVWKSIRQSLENVGYKFKTLTNTGMAVMENGQGSIVTIGRGLVKLEEDDYV